MGAGPSGDSSLALLPPCWVALGRRIVSALRQGSEGNIPYLGELVNGPQSVVFTFGSMEMGGRGKGRGQEVGRDGEKGTRIQKENITQAAWRC